MNRESFFDYQVPPNTQRKSKETRQTDAGSSKHRFEVRDKTSDKKSQLGFSKEI